MEYYSAIENEVLIYSVIRMNLKIIILNEIHQKKRTYCTISLIV